MTPGYGETPVSDEDLEALLPVTRELLGEPLTKATVYDLEQAIQDQIAEELLIAVLEGVLPVADLLTDVFLRELHRRL